MARNLGRGRGARFSTARQRRAYGVNTMYGDPSSFTHSDGSTRTRSLCPCRVMPCGSAALRTAASRRCPYGA